MAGPQTAFAAFSATVGAINQAFPTPERIATPASFVFDEDKYAGADTPEKKELFLFQWLALLERDLTKSDVDTIKSFQAQLEKLLIRHLSAGNPKPSRPLRQLIARCLDVLYAKGETRTLFDTLSGIQSLITNKKIEDATVKIGAIYCLGFLTKTHGAKLLSLFPETIATLQKVYRNAKESDIPLRYECLVALTRSVIGAGRGASDIMIKDLVKVARSGYGDKAMVIRMQSFELSRSLHECTSLNPPAKLEDYESMILAAVKALDAADHSVRIAFSNFVAALLSTSQQPLQKKPSAKKGIKVDEDTANTAEKNILSVEEMLSLLTTAFIKSSAKEQRVGIMEAYGTTLKKFGTKFLEVHFGVISKNILILASDAKLRVTHADSLSVREVCGIVMRNAIGKFLSEPAQLSAIRELNINWLQKWPSVLGTDVPVSDNALICALNEISSLLLDLGPAAAGEDESLVESLTKLATHPSRPVILALAWCLRSVCIALPSYLPGLLNKMMTLLQKESAHLTGDKPELLNRFINYGFTLSAIISAAPSRTSYISFAVMARIFGLSVQLLKSASTLKDFAVMNAYTRVSWTLIGALMCLGPEFVRVHISQLLLIWKNVFPKTTASQRGDRPDDEWEFLVSAKEAALTALYSFMIHNPKDISTTDVAKRITVALNNTLGFLSQLPAVYAAAEPPLPGIPSLESRLNKIEGFLRKRLFLCFNALNPPSTFEMSFPLLLRMSIEGFAPNPDKILPVQTGGSTGGKPGFNEPQPLLTSLLNGTSVTVAADVGAEDRGIGGMPQNSADVQDLENLIQPLPLGGLENDPHFLYLPSRVQDLNSAHRKFATTPPSPSVLSVACADISIELFSVLFPLQNATYQESTMELLISLSQNTNSKIPASRKRALQLNILIAVIGCLKYVMVKKGSLASGKVSVAMRDLVEPFLHGPDPVFRVVSSEILGRLARIVGTATFVNPLIQNIVDQVVKNREPDVRAGSSLALGYILSYVGGMAAASQLKTVVGILHSLATDPHPLVHTCALQSLCLTVESAGLMYGPFVNSTLSVLVKISMSESHDISYPAANELGKNNNSEVFPAIGRILYALVGVIGPELQMSSKVRELCFSMYELLKSDEDPFVVAEAIRCIQHFILFAPKSVDIFELIPFLQLQLAGNQRIDGQLTRKSAVTCLYQLAQRSPDLVLQAAINDQLEEQLFAVLDLETDNLVRNEIRDILMNLLQYSAPTRPSRWLDLCKSILFKTGQAVGDAPTVDMSMLAAGQPPKGQLRDDEDDDAFDVDHSDAGGTVPSIIATTATNGGIQAKLVLLMLMPRWRTQAFALVCLRHVMDAVQETKNASHFDLALARAEREKGTNVDLLVFRLADLIRMAFSAATANVSDLRLEGLMLLQHILEKFSAAEDPDFEEHALLGQYQAQIGAALTPAFANNSSPNVTSLACHVSAVYVGSGINQDLATLSRVLRLLSTALEQYKDSPEMGSGQPVSHADILLKISVLTAWARLHIASSKHTYLATVTDPNLPLLGKLWISVLTDYAKIKLEPDVLTGAAGDPGTRSSLDSYLEATRNIVLPFYQQSWLSIMQALTSLVDTHEAAYLYQLKQSSNASSLIGNGEVPSTFYLLFGLCVESLSTTGFGAGGSVKLSGIPGLTAGGNVATHAAQALALEEARLSRVCLESLARLLRSSILGVTFLESSICLELLSLLDKLVQTEDVPVQQLVTNIIKGIIVNCDSSYLLLESDASPDVTGLTKPALTESPKKELPRKLQRIIKVLFDVFINHVPSIANNPTSAVTSNRPLSSETISLLVASLDSLTGLVCCPAILDTYFEDIVPLVFYIFMGIITNSKFQDDVTPRALLCIKTLMERLEGIPAARNSGVLQGVLQTVAFTLIQSLESELTNCELEVGQEDINVGTVRNSLLGVVLVMTGTSHLSSQAAVQQRFVSILSRGLIHQSDSVVSIVLNALKTALLSLCKRSETQPWSVAQHIHLLVPLLVTWLAGIAREMRDSARKDRAKLAEEGLKLLLMWYGLGSDQKPDVLLIVINAFTMFIISGDVDVDSSMNSSGSIHMYACKTLLQLASQQGQQFKFAVSKLSEDRKQSLQKGLQSVMLLQQQQEGTSKDSNGRIPITAQNSHAQPAKIQLKSFGSFN
ncbi:armadillo-type protein [Phlyctochytrium arcticum]|nr:armadillo-type protein [Phlyctochytrium arcticum]